MDIQLFLGLGIVGAATSLFVSYIKARFGTEGLKTKAVTVTSAVIFGGLFSYMLNTGYADAVYNILSISTIIYAFIIKEN